MENKEPIKLSLSTVLLIIAVIIIIAMGIVLYMQKTNSDKQIAELENNAASLQSTIDDLQGKIDTIQNTINTANEEEKTETNNTQSSESSFTDEQVKTALANYLELLAHANCDMLLDNLTEKGKLSYDSSKDVSKENDGKITTNVKFSDYKNAMLNYVSESEFENNWTSSISYSENSDGYLVKAEGGGGLASYTIKSLTKNGDLKYSAKTTSIIVDDDTIPAEEENFDFTVVSSNGHCVIDSISE